MEDHLWEKSDFKISFYDYGIVLYVISSFQAILDQTYKEFWKNISSYDILYNHIQIRLVIILSSVFLGLDMRIVVQRH